MDDLPKLGEKLVILNQYAQSLLVNIHTAKTVMSVEELKPKVMSDPSLQPFFKAILKRFPDVGGLSQVSGAQTFAQLHETFVEALRQPYETLASVVDFRDFALQAINDSNRLVALSMEMNPDIIELIIKLVANYVKVHTLVSSFEDRKLVTACYSRAYFQGKGVEEQSYKLIVKYIQDYENVYEKIHSELDRSGARIGEALNSYKTFIDRSFPNMASFLDDGSLNMIHQPANITRVSDDIKKYNDLMRPNELVELVLYNYIAFPSELLKQGVEVAKAALQKGYMYEVHREESINFHQTLDDILESYKGNTKAAKSMLTESSNFVVQSASQLHRDRRNVLRIQLSQMLDLLTDKPGIAAPKISQVCAALGFARDEVMWYFRHLDKSPPKTAKVKSKEEDSKDPLLPEIIYLIHKIKSHLLKYQQVIRQYYVTYLSSTLKIKYQNLLQSLYQQKIDEKTRTYLEDISTILSSLSEASELEGLRVNWIRLQVFFSLPTLNLPPSATSQFVNCMSEIVLRSRYIDQLGDYLDKICSLSGLVHHHKEYLESHSANLKQVIQSKYESGFIETCKEFTKQIIPYCPREADYLGHKATKMTEIILEEVGQRIADLLHETAMTRVEFSRKGFEDQVPLLLQKNKEARENAKSGKKGTQEPDFNPGSESNMRHVGEAKKLHARKQVLKNLACVSNCAPFVVFNSEFYPKQFVQEAIRNRFRNYIMSSVLIEITDNEGTITLLKRPSLALGEIESYIMGILEAETSSNYGVEEILRQVLVEQVDLSSYSKSKGSENIGKKVGKKASTSTLLTEMTLVASYTKWYSEMILSRITAGQVLYSPLKKCFFTKVQSNLKFEFEHFTDISELIALCRIVGPAGAKMIEERIMFNIQGLAKDIKDIVNANKNSLDDIRQFWASDTQKCAEACKKLKTADPVIEKTVSIGVLLSFRSHLQEAVAKVAEAKIPHIYHCINNAHRQYPANLFGFAGYATIDETANWVGILDNVDTVLRKCFEPHCQDQNRDVHTWQSIFYLYPALFLSVAANESSSFNPMYEANENNTQLLAKAFSDISVAVLTLIFGKEKQELITKYHTDFLKISTTILLRAYKDKLKEYDSALIILEKFAEESKFLTADVVESIIPHSLIRTTTTDLYKRKGKRRGKDDD